MAYFIFLVIGFFPGLVDCAALNAQVAVDAPAAEMNAPEDVTVEPPLPKHAGVEVDADVDAGVDADIDDAPVVARADGASALPEASPGAAPAPALVPAAPVRAFSLPLGERLVYSAVVSKAGLWKEVGTAVLSVTQAEKTTLLTAEGSGGAFGYSMHTTITSELDSVSLRPLTFRYVQDGSENREKKLLFGTDEVDFMKRKHCAVPNCHDPEHFVKETQWKAGFIPWGKKRVHCSDRHCPKPEHQVWQLRTQHKSDRPYFDILSAIYKARDFDFAATEPQTIALINDKERWLIKLHVKKHGRCEVKVGDFPDAILLAVEPVPLDPEATLDKFEGLFGLNGAIEIWIDAATRRPLKIQGTVPLGPLNLYATIELTEIGVIEEAK